MKSLRLLAALPLLVACSGTDDPRIGRVLEVSGSDLHVEIDGEQHVMRLAGVVPPESSECIYEEFRRGVRRLSEEAGDVEVSTIGRADEDDTAVITVTLGAGSQHGEDLATALVAHGLVIPDAPEGEMPPAMLEAREQAMTDGLGLFSQIEGCTVSALVEEANQAFAALPISADAPETSREATAAIEEVVAWTLASGKLLDTTASSRDLRVLAYPPKALAGVLLSVRTNRKAARSAVKSIRKVRKNLRAEEARERQERAEAVRREQAAQAEAARRAESARAAAAAEERRRSSSSSGSSGGSNYSGYTGPRCYAPGGKSWRPC